MMKRFFNLLAAAAVILGMVGSPAYATITPSNSSDTYSSASGTNTVYTALITATGNDTTANADSNVLTNFDGSMKDICAGVTATNQTGTSPTLTVKLLGSFDNSVFFILQSSQDQDDPGTLVDVDSAALDINTASTTNVATGFCASQFGLNSFPPYLKVRITVGGSASPGWTGTAYATVKK